VGSFDTDELRQHAVIGGEGPPLLLVTPTKSKERASCAHEANEIQRIQQLFY
jgi:hypothetical protein